MGFVKLDDAFLDHPKFLEAGPLAGYLALCAIAWSNRNRTDGYIPAAQVMRLASFEGIADHVMEDEVVHLVVDARDLAITLVEVGLWSRAERGFVIHDYLEWQSSARNISAARAEAGKKGATARWGDAVRVDQPTDDGKPDGNTDGNCHSNDDGKAVATNGKKEEVRSKDLTSLPSKLGETSRALFDYWRAQVNKPTSKFTSDRRGKVEARLREGYTEADIRKAIDGAARAAFVNDAGKRFDDLELICRSGSKLEGFIERAGLASDAPKSSAEMARELQGRAA